MKLKASQIKPTRLDLHFKQNLTCALCRLPLTEDKAVLDHDHSTGAIRAALHRGCNSLLGKVENNHKRYGVNLDAFAAGLSSYLSQHKTNQTGLIHPTYKTAEEKKVRRRRTYRRT